MYILPNAKINIGLNIPQRRSDGYHDLQTIFYPIPITDAIEISPLKYSSSSYEFITSGISIPDVPNNNLIVKVFLSLQKEFNLPPMSINLAKHIPLGAGLGGGSSDAAFMMRLINDYFSLELSDDDMEKRLSAFGADCPFFVRNKAVYAEGIGNEFSPIKLDLSNYYILLVKPEIHISTKQAYANVVPTMPSKNLRELISETPIDKWAKTIHNDFEDSLFPTFPVLGIIKKTLYDIGAIYASMSGSGSALYGIFDRPIENASAAFPDCFVFSHKLS